MATTYKPSSRTAVYIDGYNLYYGRLRGTAHKWLDVVALFDALLRQRDQNESVAKVKFFTAPALARLLHTARRLSKPSRRTTGHC